MNRGDESGRSRPESTQPESGMSMGESPIVDQTVLVPQTDSEFAQAIQDAFFLDPNLPSDRFEIRVDDRVAYIGGANVEPRLRRRAIELAQNVQNIKKVVPVFDRRQAG
jgi:osmotically-inducible protein OsmY